MAVGCVICVFVVVIYFSLSRGSSSVPHFAPQTVVAQLPPSIPPPSPNWIIQRTGPALTYDFAGDVLNLQPQQIEQVNNVLQTIYRESLTLEAHHTARRTDDAGHVVVTIKRYPAPIAKLEDRLWSELDGILDTREQSLRV